MKRRPIIPISPVKIDFRMEKILDMLSFGGVVYFGVTMNVQKAHPRIVWAIKVTVQERSKNWGCCK